MQFDLQFKKYFDRFNDFAKKTLENLDKSTIISEAMAYSIKNGGKRVRPILCYAVADMLNVPLDNVDYFAFAVECVHAYSLVHDDLPAMDNDDYRRGKFSTHKKFGEANGILCGDALLNFAFEFVLSKPNLTVKDAKALGILAEFAGYKGMIKGQVLDLLNGNNPLSESLLLDIFENKTSKLLTAPLLIPSVLADNKYYDNLSLFGKHLGILFQITDDIMDDTGDFSVIGKTPHKDKDADKLTSIKLYGLKGAKDKAKFHYEKCLGLLKEIEKSDFLQKFTDKIYNRFN